MGKFKQHVNKWWETWPERKKKIALKKERQDKKLNALVKKHYEDLENDEKYQSDVARTKVILGRKK